MNAAVSFIHTGKALQVACDLAANYGIPVFPCKPDKKPYTDHGFKDASTDLDGLEFWFARQYPDALIGVPTGTVSGLLVIDIDPDGAGWDHEHAADLACARVHGTRRGHHYVYRYPVGGEIRNSASKIADGVDVRGEGGYVIWWPAHGLEAVGDLDDLTEPPAWLLKLLTEKNADRGSSPVADGGSSPQVRGLDNGDAIPQKRRNETLFRQVGCKLRSAGFGHGVILAAIREVNATQCVPPLADEECQQITVSAMRYEPAQAETAEPLPERAPLDWQNLSMTTPRARDWVIDHWIPRNEVTLLAGPGGIGKTGVAQALGSCVALRHEYLDYVPTARKVLMWAGEDDPDELHRRQAAIALQLGVSLPDFAGKLFLESYHRTQIDLAVLLQGRLVPTAMMRELREQIGDYGAELVILDNIARLFGGNENDRHQVSAFITMLNHAAAPTQAGIILLGHPAKSAGSEFSGSTAWEGAVRTRLYLGAKLPDEKDDDGEGADDSIRYLCRRKANYSTKDWRRIKYVEGCMVPEQAESRPAAVIGPDYAKDIVLAAVRKLAAMNEYGNTSTASPNYLPKLAKRFDLLDRISQKQFSRAMCELALAGRLTQATVGKYSNRAPKMGLVEATS